MIPRIGVEGYKYGKCFAVVNFEPNISHIYTSQLRSCVSILRSALMKMERIGSPETSALKALTPGDYPKNAIRQMIPNFRKSSSLFEGFQTLSVCLCGGMIQRKAEVLGEKACPSATWSSTDLTGLTFDRTWSSTVKASG